MIRILLTISLLCVAAPGYGQESTLQQRDEQLLRSIYHIDAPVFTGYMRFSDATAYPLFYGGPVAAWAAAWLVDDWEWQDAYLMTASMAGAYVIQAGAKRYWKRPRPYQVMHDVRSRTSSHPNPKDPFSMPSGHAFGAFVLATSVSLSMPQWYVIIPSAVWATGVTLSRPWLGVHYPTDALTGALLGIAVGAGTHLVAPYITPPFLKPGAGASPLPIRLRLFLF